MRRRNYACTRGAAARDLALAAKPVAPPAFLHELEQVERLLLCVHLPQSDAVLATDGAHQVALCGVKRVEYASLSRRHTHAPVGAHVGILGLLGPG